MGFYAAAPDHKIWYHDDGTTVVVVSGTGVVTELASATKAFLNDESKDNPQDYGLTFGTWLGFIFPVQMDIEAIYLMGNGSLDTDLGYVQTSVDSTNGQDGTWVSETTTAHFCGSQDSATSWRTDIFAISLANTKAVRIGNFGNTVWWIAPAFQNCHIYGRPSAGENPNRLRLWDPALDQEIDGSYLDFEEQAQAGEQTKTFRVKNNSATYQANAVTVAADALTAPTPTLVSQTTFSLDDSTYTSTVSLGDLPAGDVSVPVYVKVDLSGSAQLSVWRERVKAYAASWT